MKTIEELIFDKKFKGQEFDPNDFNDWAKENEYEAYTLCLAVAKQLQQHVVVRGGAFENQSVPRVENDLNGANVMRILYAPTEPLGNEALAKAGAGCVHNTLNYIGPWYSCKDCGLHFNARAEAPPEGAFDF